MKSQRDPHYIALTATQRVSACIAALARADEFEFGRLADTTPPHASRAFRGKYASTQAAATLAAMALMRAALRHMACCGVAVVIDPLDAPALAAAQEQVDAAAGEVRAIWTAWRAYCDTRGLEATETLVGCGVPLPGVVIEVATGPGEPDQGELEAFQSALFELAGE